MPMGVERSPEEVEELKRKVVNTMCSVAGATFYGSCQVAGVGASEAYQWRNEDPEFDAMVKNAFTITDAMGTDLAQSKLIKHIHDGTLKAITYWLDRKGGDRGFNPKQTTELTGPGGAPLEKKTFIFDFNGELDVPTPEA